MKVAVFTVSVPIQSDEDMKGFEIEVPASAKVRRASFVYGQSTLLVGVGAQATFPVFVFHFTCDLNDKQIERRRFSIVPPNGAEISDDSTFACMLMEPNMSRNEQPIPLAIYEVKL